MKIINADIINSCTNDTILLFTGNSYIGKTGLAMGQGLALQIKLLYPSIPVALGAKIMQTCGHLGKYCVQFPFHSLMPVYDRQIGAFQTKYHFKDKSDLKLIRESTEYLMGFMDKFSYKIALNFPGVGLGGLSVEQVYPIISILPDTVSIYVDDKTMKDLQDKGLV